MQQHIDQALLAMGVGDVPELGSEIKRQRPGFAKVPGESKAERRIRRVAARSNVLVRVIIDP